MTHDGPMREMGDVVAVTVGGQHDGFELRYHHDGICKCCHIDNELFQLWRTDGWEPERMYLAGSHHPNWIRGTWVFEACRDCWTGSSPYQPPRDNPFSKRMPGGAYSNLSR